MRHAVARSTGEFRELSPVRSLPAPLVTALNAPQLERLVHPFPHTQRLGLKVLQHAIERRDLVPMLLQELLQPMHIAGVGRMRMNADGP